jgi:uncharacterized protein
MVNLAEGTVIDSKYKVQKELGHGDAGTVYRVTQLSIEVDRAFKILNPKLPGVSDEAFSKGFSDERRKLSLLTHKNLVKLIDAGDYEAEPGKKVPYYVTDLVRPPEGKEHAFTFADWAGAVKTRDSFVKILLQFADGLSYLHSHRCLHFDIKPSNVLLEHVGGDEYELKITDLGSSKILPPAASDPHDTYVIGTPYYAPDYVLPYLNQSKRVSTAQLLKWFPHFDLFCLGSTLAVIVSDVQMGPMRDFQKLLNEPKSNVLLALNGDFDVLKRIILRLVSANKDECFPNIESVAEAFKKFQPEYILPLGVPEMAVGGAHRTLTQPREKVYFSERAYEVVEHRAFQRLHNLNQLNFVYMLYSGARHSRFSHSLATYEMAKRYIEGLLGDIYFKYLMYKTDFELFLAAALLHDIGQYPLAHAIEDLRDVKVDGFKSEVRADYEMAEHFLTLRPSGGGPSISDLLRKKWHLDMDALVRVISKKTAKSETERIIQSMLDGPIDVDKVSYLLYDSYFTGARYGLGIDLDGLLSSLVAIPPDLEAGRHSQIGLSDDGIVAGEGVISARYSMFSRVYWHHFNRAIMAMVTYAAAKVFLPPLKACTFDEYIAKTFGYSDPDALTYISGLLDQAIAKSGGKTISNPLSGLLDGTRAVHRRFLTFSGRPGSETAKVHLWLTSRDFGELESTRREILEKLSKTLHLQLEDSDVLLDVPRAGKTADMIPPSLCTTQKENQNIESSAKCRA